MRRGPDVNIEIPEFSSACPHQAHVLERLPVPSRNLQLPVVALELGAPWLVPSAH